MLLWWQVTNYWLEEIGDQQGISLTYLGTVFGLECHWVAKGSSARAQTMGFWEFLFLPLLKSIFFSIRCCPSWPRVPRGSERGWFATSSAFVTLLPSQMGRARAAFPVSQRFCWPVGPSAAELPGSLSSSCPGAALCNLWETQNCHFPSPPSSYHSEQRHVLLCDSSTQVYQDL